MNRVDVMELSMIVAMAKGRAIGRDGGLLCHMPADMRHFKSVTTGHTVVMGRRTFDSLPKGALPDRRNIVVTRNLGFTADRVEVVLQGLGRLPQVQGLYVRRVQDLMEG